MHAEVGVIGVGTMGSMALWQLAKKGVSAVGFEQFGVGHDFSAASGETRLFRTPHSPEYLSMFEDSYRLWKELGEETNQELLKVKRFLLIGDPHSNFMKKALSSLELYNREYEILSNKEANVQFPQHRLLPGEVAVVEKQAGFMQPELSVIHATRRAVELGAEVHPYTSVQNIEIMSDGVKIHANGDVYKVAKVLITTGAWTRNLLPEMERHVIPRRLISTWFAPKIAKDYSPENFPTFIRTTEDFSIHGTPSLNGSMLKVSVRDGVKEEINNPHQVDRRVKPAELERISRIVEDYLPGLHPSPVRATVYMDGYLPDKRPIVGSYAEESKVIYVCGFSGHGFKLAPVMGKIASQLVCDGSTRYDIGSLSPNRLKASIYE